MPAPYTAEDKKSTLELYVEHGLTETARRTGINKTTISDWARAAGVKSTASRVAAAHAASVLKWEERRVELAHEFGRVAALALELAKTSTAEGDAKTAQSAMTTAAIGVDKAQLLTGGATGRIEHSNDDLDQEIGRLLEKRRAMDESPVPLAPVRPAQSG